MSTSDSDGEAFVEQQWRTILAEKEQMISEYPVVLGARFLYSGAGTLLDNNGLMLAGINPGTESDESDRAFQASGVNAYIDDAENWGRSPYRGNTRAAMNKVFESLEVRDPIIAWNRMLTANYCPFRTTEGSGFLKASSRARRFSTQLWARVLPLAKIRVVICCGQAAYSGFADVRSHMETASLDLVPWPHASRSKNQIQQQNIDQAIRAIKATQIRL